MAVALDRDLGWFRRLKPDDSRSTIGDVLDQDIQPRRDVHHAASVQFPPGMHHRFVLRGLIRRAEQEHFRRCAGVASAQQPGSNDARGVERERVASGNEVGQVSEVPVLQRA